MVGEVFITQSSDSVYDVANVGAEMLINVRQRDIAVLGNVMKKSCYDHIGFCPPFCNEPCGAKRMLDVRFACAAFLTGMALGCKGVSTLNALLISDFVILTVNF